VLLGTKNILNGSYKLPKLRLGMVQYRISLESILCWHGPMIKNHICFTHRTTSTSLKSIQPLTAYIASASLLTLCEVIPATEKRPSMVP